MRPTVSFLCLPTRDTEFPKLTEEHWISWLGHGLKTRIYTNEVTGNNFDGFV